MKHWSYPFFIPLIIGFLDLNAPLYSQSISESDQSFVKTFSKALTDSCLKTPGDLKPKQLIVFCSCYAGSFVSRYSVDELKLLSILAARSSDARDAVKIALSPDRKACLVETRKSTAR